MASQADPIALYFAAHPGFVYNPTAAFYAEFDRLIDFLGYSRKGKPFKQERGRFTDAFVSYVNNDYGLGRGNLAHWQQLCQVCSIDPLPNSITQCRKVRR